MTKQAEWKVEQSGAVVASGSNPTTDGAIGTALHYLRQYAEDGPATAEVLDASGEVALKASRGRIGK